MDLKARADNSDLCPDKGRLGHLPGKRSGNRAYQVDILAGHKRLEHDVLRHNVFLHNIAAKVIDQVHDLVVPVDAPLVCHRNERCHSVTPILSKSGMTILSTTSPGRVSSLAT